MYRRILAPFLGAAVLAGMAIGCHDLPVETDVTNGFPMEKLDIESGDITPEVEYHLSDIGFDRQAQNDILDASVGSRRDRAVDRDRGNSDNPPVRGNGGRSDHARDDAASIFRRALASLELNERQIAAIEDCYEEYRTCIESARSRARAAREGYYETLRATADRIRNAVREGSLTREEARRLMHQAITEYRTSVLELHRALKAAEAECIAFLKDCIESVLTPEQLRLFNHLISNARDGGDDRGGDRGDDNGGDDNGRGDDRGGDRGDRGGDDNGGDDNGDDDNGRGDDRGGDRGDRGGDDDSGDDEGDDNGRDSVRVGRGG